MPRPILKLKANTMDQPDTYYVEDDVVEDEANPFDEAAPAGSQYLIKGVFLEAATWDNGALALTNQMLNRMPTVKITWLVQGSQVR